MKKFPGPVTALVVDDFIAHFDAIPQEKWITNYLFKDECSCMLGHLKIGNDGGGTLRAQRLASIIGDLSVVDMYDIAEQVNDKEGGKLPTRFGMYTSVGADPKTRVMNLLRWVKEQEAK